MQLEADRMSNLLVTEAEFSREIKVVMEERRLRTEDQPRALVLRSAQCGGLFRPSLSRPVIGWMNGPGELSHIDARNWYLRAGTYPITPRGVVGT